MESPVKPTKESLDRFNQALELIIRLGLIAVIAGWALQIILPFLYPVAWGAIIAVAVYPLFNKIVDKLGGKRKLAGGLFAIITIGVIVIPTIKLAAQSADGTRAIAENWKEGKVEVPPPSEKVKEWPVIGKKTYELWEDAAENLPATAAKYKPQLADLGSKLLAFVASTGMTLLMFVLSLIICSVLLVSGPACAGFCETLCARLLGDTGSEYLGLTAVTIRSVAVGVLGTAIIQATLAAIGLVVMGIPLAGVWAVIVLFLAIVQLPPILILGPIAAYTFSTASGLPATLFLVWCIFVSFADTFLKPLLLGRGVEIPMLVILIGAIGGMMFSGIIGLFVGAVVLAVTFRLFMAWLNGPSAPLPSSNADDAAPAEAGASSS